jgi:hypothetical protein
MADTVERHGAAVDRAEEYLRRQRDRLDASVAEVYGELARWWRATVSVPHPADRSMSVRRTASSHERTGALELARLEVQGALVRYFLDPGAGDRALNDAREAFLYTPCARSIERVQAAVLARHGGRCTEQQVAAAWRALLPGEDVTVGDVARQVIVAAADTSPVPIGQGALL